MWGTLPGVSYTSHTSRLGPGMVRRTYYLPHEVVVELDRAVVEAQASAHGDRAPDKSTVVTAVIRAGLAAMPAVITELRSSGRAVAKGLPLEAAAGRSG